MAESENSIEYPNAIVVPVEVHHRDCSQISTSAEQLREYIDQKNNETQAASGLYSVQRGYPKTAAERMRAYRARKKKEILIENHKKRKKSDAERARECRVREKAKNNETQAASDLYSVQRGYPKTAAERMRAYRARKKKEILIENHKKRKKSDAERARECRARKKAKTQSTANNIGNVLDPNESRILIENQTIRERIQEHRNDFKNITMDMENEVKFQNIEENIDETDVNNAIDESITETQSKTTVEKFNKSPTTDKPLLVCTWKNCKKTFRCPNGFKYHLRIHKNEKPFTCASCNKCFRSKCHLKRHLELKHDPYRQDYKCHLCNSLIKTKYAFRIHLQAHTKNTGIAPKKNYSESEKKFECKDCNRKFLNTKSLKAHIKLHSGKKPFECLQCGKKFPENHRLTRHSKVHQRQVIDEKSITKPHDKPNEMTANQLENKSKENHNIMEKKNIPKEKPTCKDCNKTFTHLSNLIRHGVTHSNVKAFACLECNKIFARKDYLIYHSRMHKRKKSLALQVTENESINHSLTIDKNEMKTDSIKATRNVKGDPSYKNKIKPKDIKVEKIDLEETVICDNIKLEKNEIEIEESVILPINSSFIENICKEELIIDD